MMRSFQYVIASTMPAASTQALAAKAQERHVSRTADLIELCSVSAGVDGAIELAQKG